jgi:GrpB-like predicted nucleotidyltransferase (UPF0157 family)
LPVGRSTGTVSAVSDEELVLRTDEELAQLTVVEARAHDGPVALVDYDPAWPALFEREAERIRGALGEAAIAIAHVGSTSVPGLAAKPIIDIVVAVADSADEAAYKPALDGAGYTLRIREPDWHEHRMFEDSSTHVHVFTTGDGEIQRMVEFRDRLRHNDEYRKCYAAAKRRLAARRWRHVQHYADAKSGVIEQILSRTRT